MFGVMNQLTVVLCPDADAAYEKGYHGNDGGKYNGAIPVKISEVVIVQTGTVKGRPTVDLVLEDQAGQRYVVMVTGRLLRSLPLWERDDG